MSLHNAHFTDQPYRISSGLCFLSIGKCISRFFFFYHCCGKISDRSCLKKDVFSLTDHVDSPLCGWSHCTLSQKAERDKGWHSPCFLLFLLSGSPAQELMQPKFMVIVKKFVFMVSANSI